MSMSARTLACQSLDAEFERKGPIVSATSHSSDVNAKAPKVGELEYLEGLLDALPAYPVGGPKPMSLRVTIDASALKMAVFANLAGGLRGPLFEQEVGCVNDQWSFTKSTKGGGEGGYWEAHYTVSINVLSNGDIEVRREGKTDRGLLFRSESSSNVVARFKKL